MGILTKISAEIKSWLQDQPDVGEETLTDFLIRNISKHSKDIQCYKFNHKKESENGADWIWCFRCYSYYYLMYVQAKKLNKRASKNHKGLEQRNINGKQIELLIQNAKSQNMLAVYAFYTNISAKTMCKMLYTDEGAFIASAQAIKKINNNYALKTTSTSPLNILKCCIGFSCLECCSLIFSKDTIANGFELFINTFFMKGSDEAFDELNPFYRHDIEDLPGYLHWIVKNKSHDYTSSNLPDWFETEYKESIKNLSGVVLLDIYK